MRKYGIALAFIGLASLISGFGMYLSHKINLTQNLIMRNTEYLLSPLPMQFGLVYIWTIIIGYIIIFIACFLIIFDYKRQ